MRKAAKKHSSSPAPIEKLKTVMAALRDPETGCPWDLEQTFETILPYTLEEAYEVADAIERRDMAELKEELGDLLLQVVYHSQMAAEQDLFTFDEVADFVADKMISRHPHVFGDTDANSAEDVNTIWDQQKDKEKSQKGALSGVARALPALLLSQKLQKKAAKTGFEWPDTAQAFDKCVEEIHEFKEAEKNGTHQEREEEFGDLLFCLTNYARMQGVNAEEALRKANNKFVKRFEGMEKDCAANGQNLSDLTLDEMLKCWERQKGK
ncbi:MAG: nucleoside triphosphate pyrophosphohydrolase [Alphaproteobacteria bacterium]|nr:nucleoside triphosphate pyrophosphohydrolase [Alphaproteobacteria bacterium]